MKLAALASLSLLLASPAQAFLSKNDLVVNATGPAGFTIPYRGKSGISDFWCAAGDYVIRDLNLSPSTRIYRTSPVPRRSGQGVSFSLRPADGVGTTGLAKVGGDPSSLTAAHADSLCTERFWYRFD